MSTQTKLSTLSNNTQTTEWNREVHARVKETKHGSLETQQLMHGQTPITHPQHPDYMFQDRTTGRLMPTVLMELLEDADISYFEGYTGRRVPANTSFADVEAAAKIAAVPILNTPVKVSGNTNSNTTSGSSTTSSVTPTTVSVVNQSVAVKYGWYDGDPLAFTPQLVDKGQLTPAVKILREIGEGMSEMTTVIMASLEPTLKNKLMHIKLFEEAMKTNRADILVKIINTHLSSGTVSVQRETMMSMMIFEELQNLLAMKIVDNNLVDFMEKVKKQIKKLRELGYDKHNYDQTDMMFGMVLIHGVNNNSFYSHLHHAEMQNQLDGEHVTLAAAEKKLTEWHSFIMRTSKTLYGTDQVSAASRNATVAKTTTEGSVKKFNTSDKTKTVVRVCTKCNGDHYLSTCPELSKIERTEARLKYLKSTEDGGKTDSSSKKNKSKKKKSSSDK